MQLSADLALEIVLNEIVEQACLAMRASGAAIILERDGEMVCRATNGPTAPELGTRLDPASGLSGECIHTLHSQRCDDAQTDARADVEASRQLGVRSVMVLPLLREGRLAGIFEVFSSEPFAFGEREERTAESFAQRIIRNLERASEPVPEASAPLASTLAETPAVAPTVLESLQAGLETIDPGGTVLTDDAEPRRSWSLTALTWTLALVVVACAFLVGQRFAWRRTASHASSTQPATANAPNQPSGSQPPSAVAIEPTPSVESPALLVASAAGTEARAESRKKARPADAVPPGSLVVYEKGREVFRLPPSSDNDAASGSSPQATGVERAAEIEPDRPVQLSPEAAEGSLLHRVEPDYPEEAREQQIQGAVVLDVRINPSGAVEDITLVSGPPLLAQAATDAVKQWRFRPGSAKGRPVEMQTRITLNFKLPATSPTPQ